MVESKGWNWETADESFWLDPSDESYYFCEKWKKQGSRSILDLGCGLGRHSLLFARNGFKVTAVDISEYAIKKLREAEKRENVIITSKVCDMLELPYRENSFDCIFSYNAVSHTDTMGFKRILDKIKKILKPDGEIFLTLCSKAAYSFCEANYPHVDENTVIKTEDGPEKNVPHFFVNLNDIKKFFEPEFELIRVIHSGNCISYGKIQNSKHYHIWAKLKKKSEPLDYSDIIGNRITGKTDRPLGTFHPRINSLYYPVNYGYVEGVSAGDGSDQDVYYLGEDRAVSEFTGRIIAVVHRFNDVEDKWVVAKDGCEFSKEEIESAVDFQEKFFDSEVILK